MVSSNKIRVGYPGRIFEIPAPSSGMGFSNTSDVEVTELDSGGRFVYRKPTTHKSFNMNWLSTTPALQPLIDMYNKRYGSKPFHMQDLRGGEGNILPARWAFSYQLAYVAGAMGRPQVIEQDGLLPVVMFTGNDYEGSLDNLSVKVMLVPGKNHYFAAFGQSSASEGIRYSLFNKNTSTWEYKGVLKPGNIGDAPTTVCTALQTETYDFIRLQVQLGFNNAFVQLYHMDLSTSDYRSEEEPLRPGTGYGGLEFTNELGGELTMLRTQRIGMSVDMIEVES